MIYLNTIDLVTDLEHGDKSLSIKISARARAVSVPQGTFFNQSFTHTKRLDYSKVQLQTEIQGIEACFLDGPSDYRLVSCNTPCSLLLLRQPETLGNPIDAHTLE